MKLLRWHALSGWLLLTVLASMLGYLQWGENQHQFLFQTEAELFRKGWGNPGSVVHPFILLPLLGQLLLLVNAFVARPRKGLIYLGITLIGLLYGLLIIIAFLSSSMLVKVAVFPYSIMAIVLWVLTKRYARRSSVSVAV
jgi:hypothetical protein